MFHTANILPRANRRCQPGAFRAYIHSSSLGPGREPFRRGILFVTVAGILLLVGGILTWLGFNDVFGGEASMTGPLLIALSVLLLLFSTRQFLIAKKRTLDARGRIQFQPVGRGAVAALVIDRDDHIGAVTVIMDTGREDSDGDTTWRAYTREYAPPSYYEVTQQEMGVSTISRDYPATAADTEPPPTYEEAIRALNANSHHATENYTIQLGGSRNSRLVVARIRTGHGVTGHPRGNTPDRFLADSRGVTTPLQPLTSIEATCLDSPDSTASKPEVTDSEPASTPETTPPP
ncbi:uncharacterized protein LOC135468511 [Liolophura sinensis]|uniref:uncharacterized protein LOC135468511 n=1 Tax=Liolophura sinensis TaxID=3198878 RepID=UPI0031597855